MSALRVLGFCYLAAASFFALAIATADPARLHDALDEASRNVSHAFDRAVTGPLLSFARGEGKKFFDPPPPYVGIALTPPGPNDARTYAHAAVPPVPQKRLVDQPRLALAMPLIIAPDLPQLHATVGPNEEAAESLQGGTALVSAERAAVRVRLENSLTPELRKNFDLFLFVSKAARGPAAQRLYVFKKKSDGRLALAYDWAASTGREDYEVSPQGRHVFTATPGGFYQLDPNRLYRDYMSRAWNGEMPHAMFFNWEHDGEETGIAIHAATGADIARLGHRASAGCVHISPDHARLLFDMIRADYRGVVPRFAYDESHQTMNRSGKLMRDAEGRLRMTKGYRVLIDIENFSGGNAIAALY